MLERDDVVVEPVHEIDAATNPREVRARIELAIVEPRQRLERPRGRARARADPLARSLGLARAPSAAQVDRHRSPLLMRCIDDHLSGRRHPLDLLFADPSIHG